MTLALLIDPFGKTITSVSVTTTEDVHALLGTKALAIAPLTDRSHTVMGKEAFEIPGQRFWRFLDSPPFAGAALIRGNSLDGLQAEDCPLDQLLVEQNVLFLDVEFDGWQTVPKFRPLPSISTPAALPQPEEPEEQPQGKPWSLWTVTEGDDGYTATLIAFDGSGKAKHTGVKLENEDLEELRSMLPPGLSKLERLPTDEPSIVESWHTATQH